MKYSNLDIGDFRIYPSDTPIKCKHRGWITYSPRCTHKKLNRNQALISISSMGTEEAPECKASLCPL